MSPTEALITLNLLPSIGPVRVRRLLERFESASHILSASASQLSLVKGIGRETASIIENWQDHADPMSEINEARSRGISLVTLLDEDYPKALRQMYDPPLVLSVWGKLEQRDQHAISMVGSRRTTHYGQQSARSFASQLASCGFTIISGLARGIDTHCHQGAIQAKGRTIAIIGSGLAKLYPPENHALAAEIADGHGAIISEFPIHTSPDKKNFPLRNRIVASWAEALVVVECPKWSGSLITANLAMEMGKTIYAIPGPIDRPSSAGCNQLIRDGATLTTSVEDILDDLNALPLQPGLALQPVSTPASELEPNEQSVFDCLSREECLIDHIIDQTGLSTSQVITTLLQLEMKRLVRQLPGPRYLLR